MKMSFIILFPAKFYQALIWLLTLRLVYKVLKLTLWSWTLLKTLTDLEEYRQKNTVCILVPTVLAETRSTEEAVFGCRFCVNVASQEDLQGSRLKDVCKAEGLVWMQPCAQYS